MIIVNDQTVFSAVDLAQLQADLIFRAGPKTTPREYLSARVNTVLKFSKSDPAAQDAVKTILGLEVEK